jgi:hypothetical protein
VFTLSAAHGRLRRRPLRRGPRGRRARRTSPSCRACRCCCSAVVGGIGTRGGRPGGRRADRRPAAAGRGRPLVRERQPGAAGHDGHRARPQPQRHRLRRARGPRRRCAAAGAVAGTLVGRGRGRGAAAGRTCSTGAPFAPRAGGRAGGRRAGRPGPGGPPRRRRPPPREARAGDAVPLEWAGIVRPFTPRRVAALDREPGPRARAGARDGPALEVAA